MKKIILFVFLAFALGACKKSTTTETTTTTSTTATEVEMPETESPAVREYMEAYDAYLVEYREALKTKNQEKMVELSNRATELSKKGSDALAQAKGKDLEKLTEYMKLKTNEFMEMTQAQ